MSDYTDNNLRAMRRQTRSGGVFLAIVGVGLMFALGFVWILLAGLGVLFVLSSFTPDS